MFKPCLTVPTFNHGSAVTQTLLSLEPMGTPCIVVNDGSTDHTHVELELFAQHRPWVTVLHRKQNGGKGAAVKDAVRCALAKGYTHLLQLDADGQHDVAVAPLFLSAAEEHPSALIIGRPLFDSSAPLARRLGREISNALLWLQTLSFCARDVLCGYRCYPIAHYGEVLLNNVLSNRMEFDPEAVVKLYWAGASVINIPTKVSYPLDGLSHFRYGQDNLMIAALHARLLAGMVLRAPGLLRRSSGQQAWG